MKWVRYGEIGQEKPGMMDTQGNIWDLSPFITDFNPYHLGNMTLINQLKSLSTAHLQRVDPNVRLGACIGWPGKVICIGFNSRLHTQQMGITPISDHEMVVFMKPTSAVCGPYDPILYTRHMKKLDWEAELGVVIGKQGKYIKKEDAKEHILGYLCIDDLSERYLQLETEDKQFTKGKCFDNSAPIGPYLVTKDEIPNANDLQIKLWVNGVIRQDFNSRDYIHNDEDVVSYVSQYFTLYPGDIISMGSAPGNAQSWGDDMFLKPGDEVVFSITHLGEQKKRVIKEE